MGPIHTLPLPDRPGGEEKGPRQVLSHFARKVPWTDGGPGRLHLPTAHRIRLERLVLGQPYL